MKRPGQEKNELYRNTQKQSIQFFFFNNKGIVYLYILC